MSSTHKGSLRPASRTAIQPPARARSPPPPIAPPPYTEYGSKPQTACNYLEISRTRLADQQIRDGVNAWNQWQDLKKFGETFQLKPPKPKGLDPIRDCESRETRVGRERNRRKVKMTFADMKKFGESLKLRTPVPEDMKGIVGKGGKGKEREKRDDVEDESCVA